MRWTSENNQDKGRYLLEKESKRHYNARSIPLSLLQSTTIDCFSMFFCIYYISVIVYTLHGSHNSDLHIVVEPLLLSGTAWTWFTGFGSSVSLNGCQCGIDSGCVVKQGRNHQRHKAMMTSSIFRVVLDRYEFVSFSGSLLNFYICSVILGGTLLAKLAFVSQMSLMVCLLLLVNNALFFPEKMVSFLQIMHFLAFNYSCWSLVLCSERHNISIPYQLTDI